MNTKKYFKYLIASVLIFTVLFVFFFYFYLYPLKYKNIILKYSKEYNVKAELIAGIICAESKFNKSAVSGKGACGLMQIMPKTAKWICEDKNIVYSQDILFTAEYNILIGTYYLNYLTNKFKNEDLVILAYNAGEGTVKNWLSNKEYSPDGKSVKIVPYRETKDYLKRVKTNINVYIGRF